MPLTHQKDAKSVVVVVSYSGDDCGVYPTKERALEYIQDWCDAGDNGPAFLRTEAAGDELHVYVVGSTNDGPDYTIRPSFYRE